MKKRTILTSIFLILLVVSCSKKESGQVVVINNSSYTVDFEFAQNYQSDFFSLTPGKSKACSWDNYYYVFVKNPSINVVRYEKTSNKFTVSDRTPEFSYSIVNEVCPITCLDPNKNIFADNSGKPVQKLLLPLGTSNIKTFTHLTTNNLIFDKGSTITFNGVNYNQISKVGEEYFVYENNDNKLSIKKITVIINGYQILLLK